MTTTETSIAGTLVRFVPAAEAVQAAHFESLIDRGDEPGDPDGYTASELAAHVADWAHAHVARLEAAVTDETPNVPCGPHEHAPLRARYAAHRTNWRTLLELTVAGMTNALLRLDDAALTDAERWPWTNGFTLQQQTLNRAAWHGALHLSRRYWTDGDHARGVELWEALHRACVASGVEGPERVQAHYNLACALGYAGRIDEARRQLAHALDLRPDLRSFAQNDPDLRALAT